MAYITRDEQALRTTAARQIAYAHREDREDLVFTQSKNLPGWAGGNATVYFAAAERHERANGVAFEEWKITLPREFGHRDNMALVRDLVESVAGKALPVVYAFHEPQTLDRTSRQPHLHLMISARRTDSIERGPEGHFKRWNREHPARGGAQKDARFSHLGAVKAHRVLVSDVVNIHLEAHGVEGRVQPHTLAWVGIERSPEPRLAPAHTNAVKRGKAPSAALTHVLRGRERRKSDREAEAWVARDYWEQRKVTLGIAPGMSRSAQVELATKARQRLASTGQEGAQKADIRHDVTQTRARVARGVRRALHGRRVRAEGQAQGGGLKLRGIWDDDAEKRQLGYERGL